MTNTLSAPITTALKAYGSYVDNEIASSACELGLTRLVRQTGLKKKQGADPMSILMAAIHAPLVMKDSTWAFCERFIKQYQVGEKDVIYRFLLRQDIRWK